MAISREGVLEGRGSCPVHVQLALDEISPPTVWPGPATLRGRVVRVFRGDVALGAPLSFTLAVTRPELAVPPGDFYYGWEGMREARYLEVFLQRIGDALRLPTNSCSEIIEAPSDVPQLAWTSPPDPASQPTQLPTGNRTGWHRRVKDWPKRLFSAVRRAFATRVARRGG